MKYISWIILIIFSAQIYSQEISEDLGKGEAQNLIPDALLNDSAQYGTPPKFFTFSYSANGFLNGKVTGGNGFVGEDEVLKRATYTEWYTKIKFPIVLKPNFKVIGGIEAQKGEYEAKKQNYNGTFYENLIEVDLQRFRFDVTAQQKLNVKRSIVYKTGVQIFGNIMNEEIPLNRYARFYASGNLLFTKTANKMLGVGLFYSYQYKRHVIYPYVVFDYWFSPKWGIESIFPLRTQVQYVWRPSTILLGGYSYSSSRSLWINRDNPIYDQVNTLLVRRDIRLYVGIERKLTRWIWCGVSTGYGYNVNLNAETLIQPSEDIVSSRFRGSWSMQISLFAVLPRDKQ